GRRPDAARRGARVGNPRNTAPRSRRDTVNRRCGSMRGAADFIRIPGSPTYARERAGANRARGKRLARALQGDVYSWARPAAAGARLRNRSRSHEMDGRPPWDEGGAP